MRPLDGIWVFNLPHWNWLWQTKHITGIMGNAILHQLPISSEAATCINKSALFFALYHHTKAVKEPTAKQPLYLE